MPSTYYVFRLEVSFGEPIREVPADNYAFKGDYLIFYQKPPHGGMTEYWRVRADCVLSMATVRQR